jgi:hypothetical protein
MAVVKVRTHSGVPIMSPMRHDQGLRRPTPMSVIEAISDMLIQRSKCSAGPNRTGSEPGANVAGGTSYEVAALALISISGGLSSSARELLTCSETRPAPERVVRRRFEHFQPANARRRSG